MTNEPFELPTYIVTSANWSANVPIDEYNAQFDLESQIMEAATRAIESFKGLREEPKLNMFPDFRGEEPLLGTTLLVHPEGIDPDEAAVVFSHMCLGNAGLYPESIAMEKTLHEQVEEIERMNKAKASQKKKAEASLKKVEEIEDQLEKNAKNPKPKKKKPSGGDDLNGIELN